jgi:hypothetical protein
MWDECVSSLLGVLYHDSRGVTLANVQLQACVRGTALWRVARSEPIHTVFTCSGCIQRTCAQQQAVHVNLLRGCVCSQNYVMRVDVMFVVVQNTHAHQ